MEAHSKARLVESPPSAERGVTATVARSEIEETLKLAEGPALLVLDIARRGGESDSDVEAHTLEVELEKPDLEQILRTAEGDAIELRFDGDELEQALEDGDVDAHGLRQKALILSVAAATAAGFAGQASGMPTVDRGAGPASAISAPAAEGPAVSGGPEWPRAAAAAASEEPEIASNAVSGGPEWPRAAAAAASEEPELATDAVSGGPEWPRAAAAAASEEPELATEAVSGGPEWPREAAATGEASVTAEAPDGGGISISSSEAAAGIAGGIALLITGASFVAARNRKRPAQA